MKCEEAERLIYLGSELSDQDRKILEEHLSTCTACTSLAQSFSAVQKGIQEMAMDKPVSFDSERLTQKVMDTVFSPESAPKPRGFIWRSFLRLGLTGMSLFLIISFYTEFNRGGYMIPRKSGDSFVVHTGGSKTLQERSKKQASLMSIIQNRTDNHEDQ